MKILSYFYNFTKSASQSILKRSIMSSSRLRQANTEKAEEELKANPFYEKYAKKIALLQETSPEEFANKIHEREKQKQPNVNASYNRQYSSLLEPKKQLTENVKDSGESLDKIMKIELIKDKNASEISSIWNDYHKTKDAISAIIPATVYDEMSENAKKHPTFLFPIPRSQGYEFIVCQYFYNTVHFTPLLNYQVHKENAPECLKVVHYTEFKTDKGIVLMKGEFDKNVINAQEAQCLANQLQLYYSQNDPSKLKLLEQFTSRPNEFKHMDLIKQIENINIVN